MITHDYWFVYKNAICRTPKHYTILKISQKVGFGLRIDSKPKNWVQHIQHITESGQTWNVNNPRHCHLVDMYGQKCLPKNLGITLIFHPPKEKKALSATKTKFWAVEIMPFWGRFEGRFSILSPNSQTVQAMNLILVFFES